MHTRIRIISSLSVILIITGAWFFCTDLNNPYDPNNSNYVKTKITALLDTAGIDTFFTDVRVRIGVRCSLIERLQSITIEYAPGVQVVKQKPVLSPEVKEFWLDKDSCHAYPEPGTHTIRVYTTTINNDNPIDSIKLTILAKTPRITKQPAGSINPVPQDSCFSFFVIANGTKPLQYQWYKDSVTKRDTVVSLLIPGADDSLYTIPRIALADSGNYFCAVMNAYDTVLSAKAKLSTRPANPDSTWPRIFFADSLAAGLESSNGSIPVYLSKSSAKTVTVECKVLASSSAAGDTDFTFADTLLTFGAGENVKNLTIKVIDDKIRENNETVVLQLSAASNGVIATDSSVCTYTIMDNDPCKAGFARTSQSTQEGNSGAHPDTILAVLSAKSSVPVSVDIDVVATQTTAVGNGVDYSILTSKTLSFAPLKDTARCILSINGDTAVTGDKIIRFALQKPTNGCSLSSNDSLTYIIIDDDVLSVFFTAGQQLSFSENADTVPVSVSLSKPADTVVTVNYTYLPDSSTATGNGEDFTLVGTGQLTFAPKETQKAISVTINDDTVPEKDETIYLKLNNPSSNAIVSQSGAATRVTILDNEKPAVAFTGNTASYKETAGKVFIPVTVSYIPKKTASVNYRFVSQGSTATENVDFTLAGNGVIQWTPQDTTLNQKIELTIVDDLKDEDNETVILELYNPVNLSPGQEKVMTMVIIDDEHAVTFQKTGSGSIQPSGSVVMSENTPLLIKAEPAANNFFTGWTADPGISIEHKDSAETRITSVKNPGVVTATFSTDICTLDVSADANGKVFPSGKVTVLYGKTFKADSVKPFANYLFQRWEVSGSVALSNTDTTNPGAFFTVTGNGTVKARFTLFDYRIRVLADGKGIVIPSGERPVKHGDSLPILARPDVGYSFTEWKNPDGLTLDNSLSPQTVIRTITKDGSVTGQFVRKVFPVTIASDDNAKGTVEPAGSFNLNYDTTIVIIAKPVSPYLFLGWAKITGDSLLIENVNASQTNLKNIRSTGSIKASFALESRTVTMIAGNGGTVGASKLKLDSARVEYGKDLSIAANPDLHWHFLYWQVLSGGLTIDSVKKANATVKAVTANGSVQANFGIDSFTVTATVATGQSAWGSILTPSTGSITIPYGDSTEVEAKAATNYEFVKWIDPQGLLAPAETLNAKVKVRNTAKSGTLTAVFKHSPVVVTIIASPSNGGSVSPNGLQYLDYQTGTLTVIAKPTDKTWAFDAWSQSGTFTISKVNDTTYRIENATIGGNATAQFKRNTFSVTVAKDANCQTVTPEGTWIVPLDTTFTITATPKSHCHFQFWENPQGLSLANAANSTTQLQNVDKSGAVTARSAIDSHDVKLTIIGNGTLSEPGASIRKPWNTPFAITANPGTGYGFSSWQVKGKVGLNSSTTTNPGSFTVTGDSSGNEIIATFAITQFQVTFAVSNPSANPAEGTVSPAGPQGYNYNDTPAVTATPLNGFRFTGWSTTGGLTLKANTASTRLNSITSSGTVTANFAIDTFKVTVNATNGGTTTPSGEQKVLNSRDLSIGIASTPAHYHFTGWTASAGLIIETPSAQSTKVKTVTTGGTVTANFTIDTHSVTIQVNPSQSGWGTVNPSGTYLYPYNTQITIKADSTPGHKFKDWTLNPGGSLTTNPYIFNVSGNISFTANFEEIIYSVSVTTDPSNGYYGTASTSVSTVKYNGTTTVTATPLRGCVFKKWRITGTGTITDSTVVQTTVTGIQTNVQLKAVFDTIPRFNDPAIVYVDSAANTNGAKTGTSWFNAYTSLALACSLQTAGKSFWVAKGTYTPVDGINTSGKDPTAFTFKLEDNDKLYGGFMGTETIIDTRDAGMNWKNYETVLSGNIGDLGTNIDNTSYIVKGVGVNVLVDGVVIRESRFQVNVGSGVYFQGENSTLNNSMITKNYGLAVHFKANLCKLLNCLIVENSAPAAGSAGLFINGPRSGIIVSNCVFALNTTVNGGSGIYGDDGNSHSRFLNCSVVKNHCTGDAPSGILCNGLDTIANCIIYGNTSGGTTSGSQIYYTNFTRNCNVQNFRTTGVGFHGDTANCIDSDPFFKNWNDLSNKSLAWWFSKGNSGLYLQSTSPKNNGSFFSFANPYYLTDILGASRNSIIDMGAYEFWP